MRKFAAALIVGLAIVQSSYAATSPLAESLLEYDAITSAIGTNPEFENVINPSEFIIDIQRITKKVNFIGDVKYKIVTRVPRNDHLGEQGEKGSHHKHRHHTHLYLAIVNVAPNPEIGPNIVTVLSITPIHHH